MKLTNKFTTNSSKKTFCKLVLLKSISFDCFEYFYSYRCKLWKRKVSWEPLIGVMISYPALKSGQHASSTWKISGTFCDSMKLDNTSYIFFTWNFFIIWANSLTTLHTWNLLKFLVLWEKLLTTLPTWNLLKFSMICEKSLTTLPTLDSLKILVLSEKSLTTLPTSESQKFLVLTEQSLTTLPTSNLLKYSVLCEK